MMLSALKHRGPDHSGTLHQGKLGFVHARLSIIDTSSGGNQPMSLPDGSVTIVLNGEIYNYRDLRDRLKKGGCHFVSSSDTEVILRLYEKVGVDCFKELIGMFAIALYDKCKDRLILARDRMGEKPLYWTRQGETILFASELGALLKTGRVKKEINFEALHHYLFADYVPTPMSIIEDVHKLEPATVLICQAGKMIKEKYWSPPQATIPILILGATEKLDSLLRAAVAREVTAADVPVGVFLSGGIDSSTIAYYAQQSSSRKIDTFSIAFDEVSFDESVFAREVAYHIGSNHHEEKLSPDSALDLVREIPEVLSEPVADASVLPTMLVSRFARKSVTVALSGDGGDELFAGYPTFHADKISHLYTTLPKSLRSTLRHAANFLPVGESNFTLSYTINKLLSSDRVDSIERHLEWLGSFAPKELGALVGSTKNFDALFEFARAAAREIGDSDRGNQLLYAYARSYLMDQVLVKVDRASMHYALETRAPFLDHTIVDFVFSLPYEMKYRHRTTKFILKRLMEGKIPDYIIHRKKKGFGVPLTRWLKGPLRPLCEELLLGPSMDHGLFNKKYVEGLLRTHALGMRDNRKELWNLMVFQLWYDRWMR